MQHCIGGLLVVCVYFELLFFWNGSRFLRPFHYAEGTQKKSFEGLVKKIELSNNSPLSDKSVSLMWIKYQLSVS